MAMQDIKDFTIHWVTFGFLFFALMIFVLTFIYNNNPTALNGQEALFETSSNNFSSNLLEFEQDLNANINTSAILTSSNTEIGAGASSATSYSFFSTGKDNWKGTKGFISWIFSGLVGKIIISVLGGMIGVIALFYIIKLLRSLI